MQMTSHARDTKCHFPADHGVQSTPIVAMFGDGEPVTGFIGAHPARVIGVFFDDHVLAEPAAVQAAHSSGQ